MIRTMRLDARIPLRLQASLRPATPDPDGLLLLVGVAGQEDGVDGWGAVRRLPAGAMRPAGRAHAAGCACCGGRSGLATGLSELFRQGAGSELGPFRQVVLVVPAADLATAERLLAADLLVTARYRVAAALG